MNLEKYADIVAFVPTPDGKHPNLWDSRKFIDRQTGEEIIISGAAKEVYGYIYDACQSRYDNPSHESYPFENTWVKDSQTKIGKYLDIYRKAVGRCIDDLVEAGLIQCQPDPYNKKQFYYRPSSRKEYLGNGRGSVIIRDMLVKPKNKSEQLPTDNYHHRHFIDWSMEYNKSNPKPKFERKQDTTQDDLQEQEADFSDVWDDFENTPF